MSEEDAELKAEATIKAFLAKLDSISDKMKNWGKSIKIVFIESDWAYWIKIGMDGKVEKVEKGSSAKMKSKEAVATLNTTTDTLDGVMDGSLDVKGAIGGGSIKIEGSREGLFIIAPAFGLG
jgi:hypothetical protein